MRPSRASLFAALLWACTVPAFALAQSSATTELREGWRLASACEVTATGEQISRAGFAAMKGWIGTAVPSTVVAARLAAGQFNGLPSQQPAGQPFDPYFGTNLRNIPGTSYPVGTFYSNQEIPADSPYHCGWWYRRSFPVHLLRGQRATLQFDGINYRGSVWVNGRQVAGPERVAGAYRRYELDVTELLHNGVDNVVAVETFAPGAKDLGINWVDWNPCPADKDMGLWGAVRLVTGGAVALRSPMVTTHFTADDLAAADLTVAVVLQNRTDAAVRGTLEGTIEGLPAAVALRVPVQLGPNEERQLVLTRAEVPALHVEHPEPWWPYGLGAQHLNTARLRFVSGGAVTDATSLRFGVRELSGELDAEGHRLFRINRHPILIRGGGWSPDMLLRESPERMREQFRLVRQLHLNTLRLEGKLETEQFFQLADEQGVLVMAGWCCCDHWEHWKDWTPADLQIATASLREQLLRLRGHASMLAWLNGSDGPPPANVETAYLDVEKQTLWPGAVLSSASATPTEPTGKSGVKMLGPYDYVAPSYWLRDTQKAGGAFGFNTETSPGPAIPAEYELRRFLPEDKLWPLNPVWDYHTGGGKYKSLAVINRAMEHIYGAPGSLPEYVRTAEAMQYDAQRAMFEAYGRNKYHSTGVVQWMLNNAWPSLIWHLYDYYLQPGAGFYGVQKANEPVHVQYSYDDRSVAVVNSTFAGMAGLRVHAAVYSPDGNRRFDGDQTVDVPEDGVVRALTLPTEALTAPLSFVRLTLHSSTGEQLSTNDYWLPAKGSQFDWPKTDYTHTEPSEFEDLTALRHLEPAHLTARLLPRGSGGQLRVEVRNAASEKGSGPIAFQLQLNGFASGSKPYDSLLWDDNFIELLPGETRVLTATPLRTESAGRLEQIEVKAWNATPVMLRMPQAHGR